MRSVLIGLLFLVSACGEFSESGFVPTGAIAQQASGSGQFTLATYNVENLFDQEGLARLSTNIVQAPKGEDAKKALSLSLHRLNADVVGLVEVESLGALKRFRDTYLADMGYRNMTLVEGNDPRGIDVAVMSRLPFSNAKSNKNRTFMVPGKPEPQRFTRDLLQVTINNRQGYTFTLFMTHLKAKIGGDKADRKREAEAREIHQLLGEFDRAHPRANYAVMGDLNDVPSSPFLGALLQAKLFDVLAELGPQAFTHHREPYRSRIDYILLSEGMRPEYVPQSARVLDVPEAYAASDHLPAVVTIDASRDR